MVYDVPQLYQMQAVVAGAMADFAKFPPKAETCLVQSGCGSRPGVRTTAEGGVLERKTWKARVRWARAEP